ncbi:glycosyl transferase family protein [Varunaivibrio sulfuroxidans]|uniref:Anthranilate phosphoribosyltransferase n=1 Tax=Varunaivibrio sulfuroxidans TaxID=1773489 RepID=A0A4R3J3B5_9PROT|nr:glycosyl transferase family protein [Varunaivibrio sulfuroxidans]TCS60329.1 anthranilate phosphoribosyltransferase [Varunaivibrio sulfuroxidans]WES30984.1 glycosyl transferase family protein [Varunaivibrio sulfuroxidans]
MTLEHPFAQYVRIIGRGPNLSRPLSEQEMYDAARMILEGRVEPLQLGAFLCILRVRTEVAEEGAGFVRATRDMLDIPGDLPEVDIDWSSYSGKKRQLPWFLLAALMLAQNGIRVAMQGTEGHTPGRTYSREVLEYLDVPIARSIAQGGEHIQAHNFCYLPLANFMPRLQEILELKSILGVRSPVNTFARMINPFSAPNEMQTVFHPNYRDVHRETATLLGQKNMAVFKGEGGEAERRPGKPVLVQSLHDGALDEETWPPLIDEATTPNETMDISRLRAVWDGSVIDPYADAAVIGTAAIALKLIGRAKDQDEAIAQATQMWETRNKERLITAA